MVMSSFSWITCSVRFSSECGKTLDERTFGMQLMREAKSPSNIKRQTRLEIRISDHPRLQESPFSSSVVLFSDSSIISFIQDIDWPLKFGKDDAVDVS